MWGRKLKISPHRIAQIESRFSELEARMASGQLEGDAFVAASREYAELEPVAKAAAEVRRLRAEIETLGAMAQDTSDPDLHAMAVEELDGFFAALACCPVPVPREEWLPMVLGDSPRAPAALRGLGVRAWPTGGAWRCTTGQVKR